MTARPDTASAQAGDTARDASLMSARYRPPPTSRHSAYGGAGAGAGSGTSGSDTSRVLLSYRIPERVCCDEFLMGGLGPAEDNPPTVPTENVRMTSVFAKAYQYAQKDLFPVFERKPQPKRQPRTYMAPDS